MPPIDEKDQDQDQDIAIKDEGPDGEVVELDADDERLSEEKQAAVAGKKEEAKQQEAAEAKEDEGLDADEQERRREERRERRERVRRAIERDKREMQFLRTRNEQVEKRLMALESRTTGTEKAEIDSRLNYLNQQIELAEQVHAKAVSESNGEDATKALQIRDQIREQVRAVKALREKLDAPPQAERAPPVSEAKERVAAFAKVFMSRVKWYDPSGKDDDSAMVLALDNGVVRDGYDPSTPDYWRELEKRVRAKMPQKFKAAAAEPNDDDEDDEDEVPSQPVNAKKPAGGPKLPSNSTGSGNGNTVYISRERKQAMIDAGVWDDPVLRKKYVKRYAEWDRQNAGRNQ
jgi:hypothetical protein